MSIDKYFENDIISDPPRVRGWVDAGLNPEQCRLERKREGLSFEPAKLWVRLKMRDRAMPITERMLWDSAVNNWLVRQGCRAETHKNEGERFGYMLRERFLMPVRQYGDGFFNSVLIHTLRKNVEFVEHPVIGPILGEISVPRPSRSNAAEHCGEMSESVLSTSGSDLFKALKYPKERAHTIFLDAVAYFLDERFNITNARLLGLTRGGVP